MWWECCTYKCHDACSMAQIHSFVIRERAYVRLPRFHDTNTLPTRTFVCNISPRELGSPYSMCIDTDLQNWYFSQPSLAFGMNRKGYELSCFAQYQNNGNLSLCTSLPSDGASCQSHLSTGVYGGACAGKKIKQKRPTFHCFKSNYAIW